MLGEKWTQGSKTQTIGLMTQAIIGSISLILPNHTAKDRSDLNGKNSVPTEVDSIACALRIFFWVI
ncbi:MAG: hypothetical protein GY906_06780 [bacterium]|nr:hypothetical protein [bacterium]